MGGDSATCIAYIEAVLAKIARRVDRDGMFEGCQRIGVAVSGGADSVALLHALKQLYPDCPLAAIHLNHSLRGPEADLDEELVRSLAASLAVPVFVRRDDIAAAARLVGGNIEEHGRRSRYRYFGELVEAGAVNVVATAHTRSDQAETVLFRLLRGSGGHGLSAIHSVRDPGIVRPMLDVSRDEILAYLRASGLDWREDSSNADPSFARNRIRHSLLPALARDWNPNIESVLANTADWALEEERFWRGRVSELMNRCVREEQGAVLLQVESVRELLPAEQRRLVDAIVRTQYLDGGSASFGHIEAVRALVAAPAGSGSLDLPGLRVERSFDIIRFARRGGEPPGAFDLPLPVPGHAVVPGGDGGELRARLLTHPEAQALYNEAESALLDWDCVPRLLRVRSWRAGDRYRPAGHGAPRKVKELFHSARVSAWRRAGWPVVTASDTPASREQIVWVREFGPAHGLSPTAATRRILALDEPGGSDAGFVSKSTRIAS